LGVSGETTLKNILFSFQGRINRGKFWLFTIAVTVVYCVGMGILFGGAMTSSDPTITLRSLGVVGGIIALVLLIALIWISLALQVKRWHDRNKSGWWVLIQLVPAVGPIWFLIECGFCKGTTGANMYGADPIAGA
jgi:uncharacterized membrane protein YhaH (DUF805 family)